MTNQEAIRELGSLLQEQIEFLRDIDHGCGLAIMRKEYINAIKLAIAALEKRAPKKPEPNALGQPCCPSCVLNVYKDEWGGRYAPCCDNCGQAIDWKDILKERGLTKEGGEECLSQD